ncbi:hypothetical protein Bca4012_058336 [Brassica carinata]
MDPSDERRERRTKQGLDNVGTSRKNPPSSSSSPSPAREDECDPWPCKDDKPMRIHRNFDNPARIAKSSEVLNRPISTDRDVYDSLFYNAWLGVEIAPTRFIDPATLKRLGIDKNVGEMMEQLGLGNITSNPAGPLPLPHQTVHGHGIRYSVSVSDLCNGFQYPTATASDTLAFPSYPDLWSIIGTGPWDSAKAVQLDIRHPALQYFMRILSSTLTCKMEPNKVRIDQLTLLYHALDGLVLLTHLDEEGDLQTLNLGAVFAKHLVGLKMKPFKGTSAKKETIGSLLTPIFFFLDIRLEEADENTSHVYMDEAHLRSSLWMDRNRVWTYRTTEGPRQFQLPNPAVTDFAGDIERLWFLPPAPPPPAHPSRRARPPRTSTTQGTPASRLAPFPEIPQLPTEDHGAFQRVVVDALQAIWARVSKYRCSSRASTSASDPAATGPSHQYQQDSDDEGDDE